jgi:hypothetical protein
MMPSDRILKHLLKQRNKTFKITSIRADEKILVLVKPHAVACGLYRLYKNNFFIYYKIMNKFRDVDNVSELQGSLLGFNGLEKRLVSKELGSFEIIFITS